MRAGAARCRISFSTIRLQAHRSFHVTREIFHAFEVHTPPPSVYSALVTKSGLSGWWTTDVDAELHVGGSIDFRFGDTFRAVMQIDRLEPDSAVEWEGVAGDDRWLGARFVFALSAIKRGTLVTFRQIYGQTISDEDYGRFNFNWGYYLQSLKKYCETGTGSPFVE